LKTTEYDNFKVENCEVLLPSADIRSSIYYREELGCFYVSIPLPPEEKFSIDLRFK